MEGRSPAPDVRDIRSHRPHSRLPLRSGVHMKEPNGRIGNCRRPQLRPANGTTTHGPYRAEVSPESRSPVGVRTQQNPTQSARQHQKRHRTGRERPSEPAASPANRQHGRHNRIRSATATAAAHQAWEPSSSDNRTSSPATRSGLTIPSGNSSRPTPNPGPSTPPTMPETTRPQPRLEAACRHDGTPSQSGVLSVYVSSRSHYMSFGKMLSRLKGKKTVSGRAGRLSRGKPEPVEL